MKAWDWLLIICILHWSNTWTAPFWLFVVIGVFAVVFAFIDGCQLVYNWING